MADKVTIADVARHAKVSRQTVSNVLNSPEVVREETRLRVQEAVQALGYRVSQAARQMRTGRSMLIASRIEPAQDDGINGFVFDRYLHGLTESAARAGYRVLLYTADDHDAELATFDDLLGVHEPDAFVLTSTDYGDPRTTRLLELGIPFVTFGRPWGVPPERRYPWVDVDGAAGTALATRYLLDAGHRRIGFLGWPGGSGVGDDRRAGWARALADAGAGPAEIAELDHRTDDGVPQGEAAAHALIDAGRPATALVCVSDSLALGALQAGRRIPVIGFDDTPVARAVGLTSVRQPITEVAASCVSILVRLLDGDARGRGAAGREREQNVGGRQDAGSGGSASPLREAPPEQVLHQPTLVRRQSA
ncbi:LacI family DNA-binding transcriptional regulator [Sphaerisporangium corydalis]|uniref:LacI family DNA-binding transcriptional regulator n=1 Tax=Sphaerisporangium corydalis TaxID=1441875 RepID=A0ABV9EE20_9ACTN|nr:LacI family DNA-binding transcriptional regulator [Sphaerisporangium corydalis]